MDEKTKFIESLKLYLEEIKTGHHSSPSFICIASPMLGKTAGREDLPYFLEMKSLFDERTIGIKITPEQYEGLIGIMKRIEERKL